MFIEGMSTGAIAKHLTDSKILTPSGKAVWQRHTIESILQNEKDKGSALLQKKYTVDFLQKKMKVNEGEVPQYYVEHSHPAIIAPEEWAVLYLQLLYPEKFWKITNCYYNSKKTWIPEKNTEKLITVKEQIEKKQHVLQEIIIPCIHAL